MNKFFNIILVSAMAASLAACGTEKAVSVSEETASAKNVSAVSIQSASSNEEIAQNTNDAVQKTDELITGTPVVSENSQQTEPDETPEAEAEQPEQTTDESLTESVIVAAPAVTSNGAIDASDLFTDRDLRQSADLSEAVSYELSDGSDITITDEGVYVLSGTASEVTVIVEAADDAKVQLVLNGVNVTNTDSPFIYVKNADKVFVTTEDSSNSITVTGTFTQDGETNTDAAVFSKDDLVLNGTGSLTISSTDNGISCKDDLKITGGTYDISSSSDAIEANDSILIADGSVTVNTNKDAIHAENEEDNTAGYVYICGGTLNLNAADDGIHATTIAQIDEGQINISSSEGIEATWVQINGGTIYISASDDGVNGSYKSDSYYPTVEINGGYTTISMGAGDTDAVDSNGNLYITGGTIDITAQSPFDYDGQAEYQGGTIIVNGQETNAISNQMMGGRGGQMGGPGGQMGGPGGQMGGPEGQMGGPGGQMGPTDFGSF